MYQLGGMVASMPMVIVRARNPNRKIVILAIWPPLDGSFRYRLEHFIQASRSAVSERLGVLTILCREALSVQIQLTHKNTDQMVLWTPTNRDRGEVYNGGR